MKKLIIIASLVLTCHLELALAKETSAPKESEQSITHREEIKALIKEVPTKVTAFSITPAANEARRWLGILDKKNYGEAWEQSSVLIRKVVTKEAFMKQARRSREPFGSLVSRDIFMAQPKTQLPGAPKGHYVLMVFKSEYHNKKSVSETIMIQKDPDNSWRVAGYYAV